MAGFADTAARLAGVAAVLLGWRSDEFWRATPEELAGVLAALAGDGGADALVDGAVVERLRAMFPDG